jgi:DNA-binding NarL/FixJ family response regulator
MDVTMPDMNGAEATRRIHSEHPHMAILALSMHREYGIVQRMLQAGADGYILKDSTQDAIFSAVQAVVGGASWLCQEVTKMLIENHVRHCGNEHSKKYELLTAREREILQLIAEGLTSKEIALRLNLSTRTVENHRRQLMDKLGLRSIAALTKYAIAEGLTDLNY